MKRTMTTLTGVLLAAVSIAYGQRALVESGTTIDVRTNEAINVKNVSDGRTFTGSVDRDVIDANGQVAIPRGSNAQLIVRRISDNEMSVDLDSVNVNGRRYAVGSDSTAPLTTESEKDGLGKNKRTGKYVGGGAAVGAIIGAIAGGGKGAAIGAATGAAAGAGAQVLTRGKSVNVPSETVLSFRLNQPLRVREYTDRSRSIR